MRTFIIVWLGQTVSLIGSSMTAFAISIWVWKLTGQATALALFGFFMQVPQLLIAPFAGVIVDRCNRKLLMTIGDMVSGLLTVTILFLYLTKNLQIWHLYLAVGIKGIFEQFQELAFSASISMMVPKQQYSRASSIGFLASYGSTIIAPALAGALYAIVGLAGILTIDIVSFVFAVTTVLLVTIPQPAIAQTEPLSRSFIHQQVIFGFRYILARPSLLALLVSTSLFWFANEIANSLYSPLILARSNGNARLLGTIASAAGIGGVVGALLVSAWGGPKRRIHGFLLGMVGIGLCKTVFGVSRIPWVWAIAQFGSSLNFPLMGSSSDAIWLDKVKTDVQGRVFAAQRMCILAASTIGYAIAGPLADYIFEPGMKRGGDLAAVFGGIFGTGKGAGIALLYVISSLGLLLVGLSSYAFRGRQEG